MLTSLAKLKTEVKKRPIKKLNMLRENKLKEQKKIKSAPKMNVDKQIVCNNSPKKLRKEQPKVLALGLIFGIAPKRFPMVEYHSYRGVMPEVRGSE